MLKWLYTAYIGLIFFVLALMAAPMFFLFATLLPKAKGVRAMIRYNNFWVDAFCFLTGNTCKVYGREKINPQQGYVFCCNHTSMADVLIVNAAIRQGYVPMGKIEAKKIPLLGFVFKQIMIFVDRSNPESRRQSLQEIMAIAKQGISVFMFAEGTRNKTGQVPLLPFKSGAFRVAIETQMPLSPLVIINARNLLPGERPPARRVDMVAYFSDPIPTIGLTEDDVDMLRDKVFAIMEKMLLENDPLYSAENFKKA